MTTYQKIIEQLRKIQNEAKLRYEYYVIHIDDVLMLSREFRKLGIRLKRRYALNGSRGNMFNIVSSESGMHLGIILVNIHRNTPRGEIYGFNQPSFRSNLKMSYRDGFEHNSYVWRFRYGFK